MVQLFQVWFTEFGHRTPYGVMVRQILHSTSSAGLLVLFEVDLCLTVGEAVAFLDE